MSDPICAAPRQQGAHKGLPATGTIGGYHRHRRAGEPACAECLKAVAVDNGARYETRAKVERACENCGESWLTTPHSKYRFCGDCRGRAKRRPCVRCGLVFQPTQGNKVQCGRLACRLNFSKRLMFGRAAPAGRLRALTPCAHCAKPCRLTYCDEGCRMRAKGWTKDSLPVWYRACRTCGDLFVSRSRSGRFCSKGCRRHSDDRVSPKIRDRVFERDGLTCQLCQEPCDPTDIREVMGSDGRPAVVIGEQYPTLDHIIPQSLGGPGEMHNLRTAHMRCNADRGVGVEGEQFAWAV